MRANSNKMFDSIDALFDSGKDLTVDVKKSHEDRIKALKESVEKKRAAKLLEKENAAKTTKVDLKESYKTKIDSKLRDKSRLKDKSKLRDESKLKDRTKLADKDLKEEDTNVGKFYVIGAKDFQSLLDQNGGAFTDGYLEITQEEANELAKKQGFFASEVGFGTEGEVVEAEKAKKCPECGKKPCVCKECDKNIKFKEADLSHRAEKLKKLKENQAKRKAKKLKESIDVDKITKLVTDLKVIESAENRETIEKMVGHTGSGTANTEYGESVADEFILGKSPEDFEAGRKEACDKLTEIIISELKGNI